MRCIVYPDKKSANADANEIQATYREHYLPSGATALGPIPRAEAAGLSNLIDAEAQVQDVNSRNLIGTAFKSQVMRWVRLKIDCHDDLKAGIAHPNRVKSAVALITKMAWEDESRAACFQNNGFR